MSSKSSVLISIIPLFDYILKQLFTSVSMASDGHLPCEKRISRGYRALICIFRYSSSSLSFLCFQPFLRRENYKLFVCFYEALMVKETDGSVEFEVSIGKFSSDQCKATLISLELIFVIFPNNRQKKIRLSKRNYSFTEMICRFPDDNHEAFKNFLTWSS